jgi:hypothetical protein
MDTTILQDPTQPQQENDQSQLVAPHFDNEEGKST